MKVDNKTWKKRIISNMEAAGTYKPAFNHTIETLSEILQQRDAAYEDFLASGAEIVVEYISDRGSGNYRKNPRLQVWYDLNTQALAYWKELGLTPAGLKRIDENSMKKKKESALTKALKDVI